MFAEQAIVVTQADDDAATEEKERMDYWGEQTALFAPIVLDGDILGIIELTEHRRRREFSSTDLRLVEALADVAAVAIENARSSGRQRIINARLSALLDTSRVISSTVVLDEVLQLIAERVAEALHAPLCYIYEYDAPSDAITWRSEYHDDPSRRDPDALGTSYPLNDYPWDRAVLESGAMRQIESADADLEPALRASMTEWGEQTMLTVPLRFGDQTVGMMEIAETQAGRRILSGSLQAEEVVDGVRAQVRKNVDIPARYGGEEFAIILPHTPASGAERVGERLSEAVRDVDEDLATLHGATVVGERVRHSIEEALFQEDGARGAARITISIGIASMAPHAADAEELVATADKALYLAKQLGKNRVEVIG